MNAETPSLETLAADLNAVKKDIAELRAELRDLRAAPRKRVGFGGPYIVTSIIIAFWIVYWLFSRVAP